MLKKYRDCKVLVTCHDSGGSNQILYSTNILRNADYLLEGPAIEIASKLGIGHSKDKESIQLDKYDLIICGSNTNERISDEVLRIAKKNNIRTIGFLDNWTGYKNRWDVNPDIIVAGDFYSFLQGFFVFGFKIRFLPSQYLKALKTEKNRMHSVNNSKNTILVILQPIDRNYKHSIDEISCICGFFIKSTTLVSYPEILLRQHFSTDAAECLKYLCEKFPLVSIRLTNPNSNLLDDLDRAGMVVGMDSYALYVAKRLGYPVKSLNDPRWTLFRPRYAKMV